MFGSSFFYIQSCSNTTIASPCILAVNQNGLNFLNKETHVGVGRWARSQSCLLALEAGGAELWVAPSQSCPRAAEGPGELTAPWHTQAAPANTALSLGLL